MAEGASLLPGLTHAEAGRRARLEFGEADLYREQGRESRGLKHLDELRTDIRYTTRSPMKIDPMETITTD